MSRRDKNERESRWMVLEATILVLAMLCMLADAVARI